MVMWKDGTVDLGHGWSLKVSSEEGGWSWYVRSPGASIYSARLFKSESSARRSVTRWMRAAIKKACTLMGF